MSSVLILSKYRRSNSAVWSVAQKKDRDKHIVLDLDLLFLFFVLLWAGVVVGIAQKHWSNGPPHEEGRRTTAVFQRSNYLSIYLLDP